MGSAIYFMFINRELRILEMEPAIPNTVKKTVDYCVYSTASLHQ